MAKMKKVKTPYNVAKQQIQINATIVFNVPRIKSNRLMKF